MSNRNACAPIAARKVNSTIRQLSSKLSAFENSIIFYPSTVGPSLPGGPPGQEAIQVPKTCCESLKFCSCFPLHEWEKYCQVSGSTRKHLQSLMEYFKGEILRLAQPQGNVPSLLNLSAFSMGRIATEFEECEFEDLYDLMPLHTWQWILFQHSCCLVMQHIAIDHLLPRFAILCLDSQAYYQAFEFIKYFWFVATPILPEEYRYASCTSNF